MKNKIIVLAGNREQFEKYLDDNGLTDSEAVYGYSKSVILGVRATQIVATGTFWDRKDANKLSDTARVRLL